MLTEKPYFTVHIEADFCAGYFLLNGQFLQSAEIAPVRSEQPINHWVREGENELLVMLGPVDEQGNFGQFSTLAKCQVTVKVRKSGSQSNESLTIALLQFVAKDPTGIEGNTPEQLLDSKNGFAPGSSGDVRVGKTTREPFNEVGAIVKRSINLPELGLPEWSFFRSDNITSLTGVDLEGRLDEAAMEQLQQELLPVYRKIWNALDSNTVDEILPLFEERSREMDEAFFKSSGETQKRLAEVLNASVQDPDRKLWPITDDNVMVQPYDNNKLVRLSQNNGNPLLSFDYLSGGAKHFDVIFRKSGSQWIITR